MFRGTFARATRAVPEFRTAPTGARTSATAGLAEADLHGNEHHDEWVRTDVVSDGENWTARFSDITSDEVHSAAARMGLVRRPHRAPVEELDSDSRVEEIDADAQMRELQPFHPWAVHSGPFASVTELALQMAQRPRIQRALLEELRSDERLRHNFEKLSRQMGVNVELLPLSGHSPALIAAAAAAPDASDNAPGPLEALFSGLLNAAERAGAAIGAYVKRMLQHIAALGRLLQGKHASSAMADGVVFDDESAATVDKAQVIMDMSIAVASLLVLVAVLGRVGVRGMMRA